MSDYENMIILGRNAARVASECAQSKNPWLREAAAKYTRLSCEAALRVIAMEAV